MFLINCNGILNSENQNFEKAKISNDIFTEYSQTENLFICKDSVEDFDNGYSKIELNSENLKILNSRNGGYESTQIELIIDKELNIKNAKYSYSDDVEDGSETEYEVIDAKININQNPFENNSKSIVANYVLKIRETYIPAEFWKIREYREYNFKGKIECK